MDSEGVMNGREVSATQWQKQLRRLLESDEVSTLIRSTVMQGGREALTLTG